MSVNERPNSAEGGLHRIVAEREMRSMPIGRVGGFARRYTCACGEQIDAHPDVLDEAFEFHLTSVTSPEGSTK